MTRRILSTVEFSKSAWSCTDSNHPSRRRTAAGISSERKLVEELRMHLAWRWFTGRGFNQEIPHPSTFSKNRHGRFEQSKLFEQLFEQIVRQCVEVGLVQGKHLSVDGSIVEANAAKGSRIPRSYCVSEHTSSALP